MRSNKPILLVEDDEIDAMTVQRAMKELKITNELVITRNGEEALEYLKDATKRSPSVILMDLNMPRMTGIELLEILKADEVFKKIPAIVLTTSSEDSDRLEAFKLSIAGYIVKPVDYMKFVDAVRTINLYWTLSEMPPED